MAEHERDREAVKDQSSLGSHGGNRGGGKSDEVITAETQRAYDRQRAAAGDRR